MMTKTAGRPFVGSRLARHTGRALIALAAALALGSTAQAADEVKIGLLSTLSGPGAGLGLAIRDGFNLALEHRGGKLGGLPAEVLVVDDQQNQNGRETSRERVGQ